MWMFLVLLTIAAANGYFQEPNLKILKPHDLADDLDEKIAIGRVLSGRGQFPYQVAIYRQLPNSHIDFICGGAIISSSHILTAAHCVNETGHYYVKPGLMDPLNCDGNLIDVHDIVTHPAYHKREEENDMAVVKLARPLVFDEHVMMVQLPASTSTQDYVGKLGIVSGVNIDEKNGHSKNITVALCGPIKYTKMAIFNDEVCKRELKKTSSIGKVCTGIPESSGVPGVLVSVKYSENNVNECIGDSGGPLVVLDQITRVPVLVGVAPKRHKDDCGGPKMFTDVRVYLDWIREKVE